MLVVLVDPLPHVAGGRQEQDWVELLADEGGAPNAHAQEPQGHEKHQDLDEETEAKIIVKKGSSNCPENRS